MVVDLGAIKLEYKLVTDDLSVLEITLQPGAESGLHRHTRERETFYVLSGEIHFVLEGQELHVRAGEVVSIPINALRRFRNPGSSTARAVLMLNPGGLAQYFIDLRALLDRRASSEDISQLGVGYGLEFVP